MFLEFLFPLHEHHGLGFLNVFRYITFRSAYAAVSALFLALLLGKPVIAWLRRFRIGQKIREDGPAGHQVKAGTPTMGGVLMLLSIAVPVLLFGNLRSHDVLIALFATLWLGAVGFLDDYLRVVRGLRKGLLGRYKLAGQIALGILIGVFLLGLPNLTVPPTMTTVPFLKFRYIDLGILFVPFVVLVITGSSNAVNLTDGLDGLATGLVIFAGLTFAGFAYVSGHARFHGRGDPERLVNPGEVVMHVVERERRLMVVHLFGEGVGQAREAAHAHPHREVLALHVAG